MKNFARKFSGCMADLFTGVNDAPMPGADGTTKEFPFWSSISRFWIWPSRNTLRRPSVNTLRRCV
jgi:hypothetical protein